MTFKKGQTILSARRPGAPVSTSAELRPLPSLSRQAANVASAVGRTVVHVASGHAAMAELEEVERRLALCRTCSFFRPQDERCAHAKCGCFTQVKVRLAAEQCPATPPKW